MSRVAAPVLVVAMFAAIALIPDHAVMRPKVAFAQAFAVAALGLACLHRAASGSAGIPWPHVILAGLVPAAIVLAWLAAGSLPSTALARDELLRVTLVSVIFVATASCLGSSALRWFCLGSLAWLTIPVAGEAVGESLSGVLDLPFDRAARSASNFGNPVFLGAFLVLVIPTCIAVALFSRGLLRWVGAMATGLALPALLATQSRWAWLGGAAGVACGITLMATNPRHRRLLLIGLLGTGLILAALSSKVLLRPQNHALIWRDSLQLVAAHPWGVGPGQYQVAFLPFASEELLAAYPRAAVIINDAHCEPLQLLAELGWPGLLAVVLWLVLLGRSALRRLHAMAPGDPERPMLVAILAGLTGSVVQSFGSPDLRFHVSSLLFGALAGIAASMDTPVRPAAAMLRPAWRLLLGAMGLAALGWVGHSLSEHREMSQLVRPPERATPAPGAADRVRDLLAAVRATPDDPAIHYELGVALADSRRYREAAVAFRRSAALSNGRATVIRSLGIVEAQGGEFPAAVEHLTLALGAYPDDAEVRYHLAYSAYGMGDIATAIATLETLLAAHPEHRLGRLLLKKLRE